MTDNFEVRCTSAYLEQILGADGGVISERESQKAYSVSINPDQIVRICPIDENSKRIPLGIADAHGRSRIIPSNAKTAIVVETEKGEVTYFTGRALESVPDALSIPKGGNHQSVGGLSWVVAMAINKVTQKPITLEDFGVERPQKPDRTLQHLSPAI